MRSEAALEKDVSIQAVGRGSPTRVLNSSYGKINSVQGQTCETGASVLGNGDGKPVAEVNAQFEACRQMAQWGTRQESPTRVGQSPRGREVIAYYDTSSPTTILGEVFAENSPSRFVRVVLSDKKGCGIDDETKEFLQRKGAFDVPPQQVR